MDPIDWALLPLRKYAVFTGRAPRAEFWWFTLLTGIAGFFFDAFDRAIGSEVGLVGGIYNLALAIPSLAVTVRRLHDIDRSGWWLMAFVIPIVAVFATFGLDFLEEPEIDAMTASQIVSVVAMIFGAALLFIFSVIPGTSAANRYGADPYDDAVEATP